LRTILVIAGETSGDNHAAKLVREMKNIKSDLQFFGIGGDALENEGVDLIEHLDRMAVMGFFEIVRHIPFMKKTMVKVLYEAEKHKVDLVILVDYPGFNLRLAEKIKKSRDIPNPKIFYYISPQVWAWGAGRIPKIAHLVDRMAGIIPFETDVYAESGLDFHFVGHPLLDDNFPRMTKEEFFQQQKFNPEDPLIALLPGSRIQEVSLILPILQQTAKIVTDKLRVQIAVAASGNVDKNLYGNFPSQEIIFNQSRNLQRFADLVITASGTSTLETAIAGTPMIVVYKVHPLSYQIGKMVVKVKNIALANLVAGETVVPEFIQNNARPKKIAAEALRILTDANIRKTQIEKLSRVKEKLGEPGASRRAAELALKLIT